MLGYNLILYLHIVAAIIWLGAGFVLHFLAWRAERAADAAGIMTALGQMGSLGNALFMPASLATLAFGIGLVLVGGWEFAELWIVLALAGYAASFGVGAFVLKPRGEAIGATVARDGITAEVVAKGHALAAIGRVEAVILYLVVALMALKPTAHDIGILAGLGIALAAGVALALLSGRTGASVPLTPDTDDARG